MISPCFDDSVLQNFTPRFIQKRLKRDQGQISQINQLFPLHLTLSAFLLYLSFKPLKNLVGPRQVMNTSYNQFALVNTYGLFGGVTKNRYEIVLKGTADLKFRKRQNGKNIRSLQNLGLSTKSPVRLP